MAKAEASVEELVRMIERGELRLPEMQRRYVWRSTRVRDLLDSLYRGYPSGAILIWETDENVPLQDFGIKQAANPYPSTRLLLDGQQRLTSLSAIIRGEPVVVRGREKPVEILFNLEHPDELTEITEVEEEGADDEEAELGDDVLDSSGDELQRRFERMTFVVSTKKLIQDPRWVKVTDVFKSDHDAPILNKVGIKTMDDPRFAKYSQRLGKLRAIRKYSYRMDILERNLSYNEVTEIFVRVNSLGAKLRSSDLALAQITAKWRGSLKKFLEFQEKWSEQGFYLDLGVYLKNLVVFATGQSRFLTASSIPVEKLQDSWTESSRGLEFAFNFMRSNAGINSSALLSSYALLITLSYYAYKRNYLINSQEEQELKYWLLLCNAKGRYTRGSTETFLDQDLAILKKNGSTKELVERLKAQVGRLDFTPQELEGRNQRSSIFKTMFLAFRESEAKDWNSNLMIDLKHSGVEDKLQFHHIFPKALLSKAGYSHREEDDIANLAFIGGKTNRTINDKSPEIYFKSIIEKSGVDPLQKQCIPLTKELLSTEKYKEFLSERRRLICERLNEYLKVSSK